MSKVKVEEPEEVEAERYYVIESIKIMNMGTGTIKVNIIQQGQPTPPPKPPGK